MALSAREIAIIYINYFITGYSVIVGSLMTMKVHASEFLFVSACL